MIETAQDPIAQIKEELLAKFTAHKNAAQALKDHMAPHYDATAPMGTISPEASTERARLVQAIEDLKNASEDAGKAAAKTLAAEGVHVAQDGKVINVIARPGASGRLISIPTEDFTHEKLGIYNETHKMGMDVTKFAAPPVKPLAELNPSATGSQTAPAAEAVAPAAETVAKDVANGATKDVAEGAAKGAEKSGEKALKKEVEAAEGLWAKMAKLPLIAKIAIVGGTVAVGAIGHKVLFQDKSEQQAR